MVKVFAGLTEDERKALRGSKFAPLPSQPSSSTRFQPRVAHPGGAVATNKAVALAKFLGRKLQEPGGLDSLNPDLVESAVKNAKETVIASGTSKSGQMIRHVVSFDGCEDTSSIVGSSVSEPKKLKKKTKEKKKQPKKNKRKNKKLKI